MSLCNWLELRRNGACRNFAEQVGVTRLLTLESSITKRLMNEEYIDSWTSCLDIESVEQRYLLTALTDGRLVIFDLESPYFSLPQLCRPIASVPGSAEADPNPPRGNATALEWYACDTGMFMSGHLDGVVRFWDTNRMATVLKFDFRNDPQAINCASLSPTGRHSIVAIGRKSEPCVRLADYRTRSTTHTLTRDGHSRSVRVLRWHPVNENVVASGGSDGKCLAWDVRSPVGPLVRFEVAEESSRKVKPSSGRTRGAQVCGLQFAARGNYLVSLAAGSGARLWTVHDGRSIVQYDVFHTFASGNFRFAVFDAYREVQLRRGADSVSSRTRSRSQFRVVTGRCSTHRRLKKGNDSDSDEDGGKAEATGGSGGDSLHCRSVVALPDRSNVCLFDLHSAAPLATLRGHLGELRCITSRGDFHELYTSATDHQVICWSPRMDGDIVRQLQVDENDRVADLGAKRRRLTQPLTSSVHDDNWSDSD